MSRGRSSTTSTSSRASPTRRPSRWCWVARRACGERPPTGRRCVDCERLATCTRTHASLPRRLPPLCACSPLKVQSTIWPRAAAAAERQWSYKVRRWRRGRVCHRAAASDDASSCARPHPHPHPSTPLPRTLTAHSGRHRLVGTRRRGSLPCLPLLHVGARHHVCARHECERAHGAVWSRLVHGAVSRRRLLPHRGSPPTMHAASCGVSVTTTAQRRRRQKCCCRGPLPRRQRLSRVQQGFEERTLPRQRTQMCIQSRMVRGRSPAHLHSACAPATSGREAQREGIAHVREEMPPPHAHARVCEAITGYTRPTSAPPPAATGTSNRRPRRRTA